jgi:hypothetical protein
MAKIFLPSLMVARMRQVSRARILRWLVADGRRGREVTLVARLASSSTAANTWKSPLASLWLVAPLGLESGRRLEI